VRLSIIVNLEATYELANIEPALMNNCFASLEPPLAPWLAFSGRVGAERVALAVTSFGSPKAPHISPLPSPNRTWAFQRILLSIEA
jgi:hypothetical protein